MKLKLLSDNLILELEELEKDSLDILSTSNKAIILYRNRSRMRELFNLVAFDQDTNDKRK